MHSFEARWQEFVDGWGFSDPTDLPAPARRAFARLPVAEQVAAIAGGRRYRSHCRIHDRKAKHARSWLNDRGWEASVGAVAGNAVQFGFDAHQQRLREEYARERGLA